MAQDVRYLISLQDKFSGRMNKINQSTQRFDKSLVRTIGRFATFAAVGAILGNSIKKMADFEEQVSNLSAITGATGDDLDFLKRKAIELGKATTKSSIDTVKAFKLIASAKPELLENASALAAVTKEAITLSEASGLELPAAANALTDALNQFGLGADQSSRVINLLAAGSKFAAAEIPDLTNSLKEFGGVADSLGISIEQSAAAVETLSTKGLKGARAGIQMRNILLKLGSSLDKKINPKVVGLSKALENLAPIQDDVNKLNKMFGRQNVIAAQTLIKQRERVDELTESMTGTNIAYEQARVNTDNLNSDVKRLSSAWEGLVLNLNRGEGKITNSLRNMTKFATDFLEKIDRINTTDKELSLRKSSKEMDNFKASIQGVTDMEVLRVKTFAEMGRAGDKLRKAMEDIPRLGGEKKINKAFVGITRSVFQGSFNRTLNIERVNNRERRASLKIYVKQLKELLDNEGQLSKLLTTQSTVFDDTAKGGAGDLSDQVTRITSAAPKVFNINIDKFVENFSVNSETITESGAEVRDTFIEMWLRMLADAQAISN
jgi:TP901 family phage tail tape measure protein